MKNQKETDEQKRRELIELTRKRQELERKKEREQREGGEKQNRVE